MIASTAMISIVAAAFLASGGLNAGTPFDTASTPVIAVHPLANALRIRNSVNGSAVDGTGATVSTGATVPASARHVPTAISSRIDVTKK